MNIDPSSTEARVSAETCPVKPVWLRRLGAAAFLFFLLKGLLWLLVPAAIALWKWG